MVDFTEVNTPDFDNYLALLPDIPCTPNMDNSITGTVVVDQSWCLQRDGLAD